MKIDDLFESQRIITNWLEMLNPFPIRIFYFLLTFPNLGSDSWWVKCLKSRGLRRGLIFLVKHIRVLELELGAEWVPLFWQFVLSSKSSWTLTIRVNFFNHPNIHWLKLLKRIFRTVGLIHFNFFQISYALAVSNIVEVFWSYGLADFWHFNIGVKIEMV